MRILIINIILVIIEALVVSATSLGIRQKRKLFLEIAFIQLFVVHAFLDPYVMDDLPGYLEMYETFGQNRLYDSIFVGYVGVKMEPGWVLLCKLLYCFTTNPRTILIVTSIIIVGSYMISIYRYSYIAWLSVFILLTTNFDQSLFVLRQHTAIAMCLLTIPYIINRNWLRFGLVVLLAMSIHQTAFIFVLLYIVYPMRFEGRFAIYYSLALMIAVFFVPRIMGWAFGNLWYNGYEDREGSNLTAFFIEMACLILFLFSKNWKVRKLIPEERVFFIMISLATLISLAGAGFSPTNRLVKYFSVSELFIIPMAIVSFKDKAVRIATIFVILFFYSLLFFSPSNTEYIKNYHLIFLEWL